MHQSRVSEGSAVCNITAPLQYRGRRAGEHFSADLYAIILYYILECEWYNVVASDKFNGRLMCGPPDVVLHIFRAVILLIRCGDSRR